MHAYPDNLEVFVRDHWNQFELEPATAMGTRHRSAYRLCKALPGSVALVISQDAGLRVVSYLHEQVMCWEQLTAGVLDI